MKRFVAISLMCILFFNWYGYRLLTAVLESRADHQLEARLDGDSYDESQLISIKVPSTRLSYYNSSMQFERVDGQIEVGGVRYKYVKRRLFNDSLEVLCIPNQAAMQLQTAKNEFYKGVNGLRTENAPNKKSGSNPGASKNLSTTDYYTVNDLLTLGNLYFTSGLARTSSGAWTTLRSALLAIDEQPPDVSSLLS